MSVIFYLLWPETLLIVVGCLLFLVGMSQNPRVRRIAPVAALASLVAVFVIVLWTGGPQSQEPLHDQWNSITIFRFQEYVKLISAGVGVLLVLLAWPTNPDATGNPGIQYGHECGEFFGLMILSIAGIFMVASANDLVLLFLGIELASIPTYIMVSISRPVPVAQEAGVKYFFLGAMAAALMLFGFSYLYGTTGQTNLDRIGSAMHLTGPGNHDLQLFAVIITLIGLTFKIAAVPLHSYVGDVYQGAATPLTALLGFVPKTSGFIAIIKILYTVSQYGDSHWVVPDTLAKLLWVLAVLTMFIGNVLAFGSLQHNVKRVLAYSSVAHSGYMLAGVTVLVTATGQPDVQQAALGGVLFYLAAYGLMNTGAFGVLTMLPARTHIQHGFLEPSEGPRVEAATGTSAETFEDIAGQGRRHLFLGLSMSAFCWSLTGLPLTVGFFGKLYLIWPMLAVRGELKSRMVWLVILLVINAAISAAYYLRIIGTLFLRPEHGVPHAARGPHPPSEQPLVLPGPTPWPIAVGVALCVMGTIAFGVSFGATGSLANRAQSATLQPPQRPQSPAVVSAR